MKRYYSKWQRSYNKELGLPTRKELSEYLAHLYAKSKRTNHKCKITLGIDYTILTAWSK